MNERLQQLMSFHEGLEQNRRNALYASILLAVLVIAGVGYWSNSAATRAVMTHASYDDLTTALGVLDEAEIVGTIDNEGNLWVDSSQLGAAKRALVGKSHLHSIADVGELQPGLDPNTRKWALLRQAEGDIAKTLNDYDYVLASNVAITPFHEGLFKGEDEPATASIQLKLRPNTNLSQEQVRSVVASVSNSVRGLDPDRVTITDQSGNLLADGTGAEGGTIADVGSELATLKLSHERSYERKASRALNRILGAEGFTVAASVDLVSEEITQQERMIDTDKQAVVSSQAEETESTQTRPEGVPGTDANLPERAATPAQGGSMSITSKMEDNMDYPTTEITTYRPPGSIERVSMAVQIDSTVMTEIATASEVAPEVIEKRIAEAVQGAIGFDVDRNDMINLTVLPFTPLEFFDDTSLVASNTYIETAQNLAPHAVAALALLLLFFFVVRPLMSKVANPALALPLDENGLPEEDAGMRSPANDPDADLASRLRLLVDNYQPVDASDLNRLVNRESAAAAQVVRQWKRNNS